MEERPSAGEKNPYSSELALDKAILTTFTKVYHLLGKES
jgi:hypothetical protein